MTLLLWSAALLACAAGDDGPTEYAELGVLGLTVYDGWVIEQKAPAAGYTVALDDGAGMRTEKVTDEDGQVGFLVDWSRGPVDVVIDCGGLLQSLSGIEREPGELELFVHREDAMPSTVTVSGTLSPRTEGTQGGVWMQDLLGSATASWGDSYSVTALAGEPLVMLALEGTFGLQDDVVTQDLVTWKLVEHEALARDTTIDIDLSEPDSPHQASGFVLLPEDDRLRQQGTSVWVQLNSGDRIAYPAQGWITWGAPSEDHSSYDFDVAWTDLPQGGQVDTVVQIAENSFDHGAITMVPGTPDTWLGAPVVMPTPTLEDPGEAWEGDRVFRFEARDEVEALRCVEVLALGDTTLWQACSSGSDEIRLPAPPSTADPDLADRATKVRPWYHDMEPFDWFGPTDRELSWGPVERL